jgi:hypothetical protein
MLRRCAANLIIKLNYINLYFVKVDMFSDSVNIFTGSFRTAITVSSSSL